MNEIFDVVDNTDRVIKQEVRSEVHRKNLLHRAVHILISKPSGELVIQQRSPTKDLDPFLWTSSCSGHVDAGEDYLTAAVRECKEEIGIEIIEKNLTEILRLSPCNETGNEFVRVYFFVCREEISFNEDEIIRIKEHPIQDIENLIFLSAEDFSSSFVHIFSLLKSRLLNKSRLA